ncbi:hypothetical protein VMCG_04649 [Cytospora schulzeri]|uniref:LPXTG-domain-containing protein n=1 Tax=Cytospora schulzeri TaxID=448051 RepID=A0A423WRQ0_9PEZI|nr:hypothetical protein VMCG_04649 [Valsa malicola]
MAGRSIHRLLFAAILPFVVLAIQVAPNSPCSSVCVDSTTLDLSDPNSSNTVASGIVCEDADFTSTSDGKKWDQCMTCLQSSTFVQGGESDQYWFLYNLRYIFDHCVFRIPNGTYSELSPCATDLACGPLKSGLEYGNLSTIGSEFAYCDADGGAVTGEFYDACHSCVSSSSQTQYVANTLVALEAGCQQRPNVTSILGLDGTVFSSASVNIVDPASLVVDDSPSVHISTAAIAGIAVGAAVLILVVAGCILIRRHKRAKRRAIGTETRWGSTRKTHKRKSSFSFRCRHILSSPISPKFFRDDLTPVDENKQYGSLDQMASSQVSGITGEEKSGRYYIESKSTPQRFAYEPAWGPQQAPPSSQSFAVPPENMDEPDQHIVPGTSERRHIESNLKPQRFAYEPAWSPQYAPPSFESFAAPPENVEEPDQRLAPDTTERTPVESKPKSQRFAYEPVWSPQFAPPSSQSFTPPPKSMEEPGQQQTASRAPLSINTAPTPPEPARRSPRQDTFSVLKAIHNPLPPLRSTSNTPVDSWAATTSSPIQAPNGKSKSKVMTMSSQGNGYPGFKSPNISSPLLKQKSGWPSPRQSPDGWSPPPSPPGSSASPFRYGRKTSASSMRKRRESGSPVESKHIQVSFPAPPQK